MTDQPAQPGDFDPDDPALDEGTLDAIATALEDDPNDVDPYVDGAGSVLPPGSTGVNP